LSENMRVIVTLLGTEIRLKQEVSLDLPSPALKEALRALRDRVGAPLEKFLKEDLSPMEGCTILLNGRNIGSLGPGETKIQDGDEITFTVLVAGG
jgi:molybdopterin converting factor small subunit